MQIQLYSMTFANIRAQILHYKLKFMFHGGIKYKNDCTTLHIYA